MVSESVPEGYKEIEVGVIPEDWEVKRLGEVAKIVSGGTPSTTNSSYWHGNIKWCTPTDITKCKSKYLKDTEKKITRKGLDNSSATLLPRGALLLCTRATIGEVKIAYDKISTNQGFKSLICKNNVYNEYLYYYIDQLKFKLIEKASGSTFLEISKKDIALIEIILPPLPEQKAIARVLSDVDELIASMEKLIDKKEKIKQGTMQLLLTGKKRLPGFTGEWEVKRLGEVARIVNGGTPRTANSSYWNGNIKWCTPTDITKCKSKYLKNTEKKITRKGLDNSSATLLPRGALLLCSRATIGEVRIAYDKISTNQGFKSLICKNNVYNEYLYYYIDQLKFKLIEKASGSTFLEISKKDIARIEIILPPLPEQQAIAQILSDMDAEIESLQKKRDKYKLIKEGMMDKLLTGKVRLI